MFACAHRYGVEDEYYALREIGLRSLLPKIPKSLLRETKGVSHWGAPIGIAAPKALSGHEQQRCSPTPSKHHLEPKRIICNEGIGSCKPINEAIDMATQPSTKDITPR